MEALIPIQPQPPALAAEDFERISRYAKATISPKTEADYGSAWKDFEAYCARRGFEPLPAGVPTLAAYLTALADAGASVSQIDLKRSAIRYFHHIAGHASPTEHPQIIELAKGIRRERKVAKNPKDELTLDHVRRIVAAQPATINGLRDRAMLLMGYWGAFRRSELVAVRIEHVKVTGDAMRVTLPKSKTDQAGAGKTKTMKLLPGDLADVCPVRAYRAWIDAGHINSGLVFRPIDRWGNVTTISEPMDGKEYARLIKRAVASVGLEPRQFAGHSTRRGFVTDGTDAGATSADLRETTGHESDETLKFYQAQRGRGSMRAVDAIVARALGNPGA